METFKSLLDRRPLPRATKNSKEPSRAELTAFIDSRVQYMNECANEAEERREEVSPADINLAAMITGLRFRNR